MAETEEVFGNKQIKKTLRHMAKHMLADDVYLVGIQTGGALLATALQKRLTKQGCRVHRGDLDISFYRDDVDSVPLHPVVLSTELPFDINDRHIWLVDDVLFTGRTIRAALDELFDYGRPASVSLAVLVDRGGRQLPIHADVVGLWYSASETNVVDLNMTKKDDGKTVWSIAQHTR